MLQYLLNASAIWLISLAVYHIFLLRESYHAYNRCYLLLTFAAGLLLPAWHGAYGSIAAMVPWQLPAMRLHMAAAATAQLAPATQWLTIAYITGAAIATLLLAADSIRLWQCYARGRRSMSDGWLVVETHRVQAPFSFFNMLFVSSRKLYNSHEWHMLLAHEQQHRRLLHFADLLLMQVARIIFWFHPLVYLYHRRISMVHEYQADSIATRQPAIYGRFLVEQAMLRSAPAVAHALSNAPLKSRLLMLRHTSPVWRRSFKLLLLPLLSLCAVCFTRYDAAPLQDEMPTAYTPGYSDHAAPYSNSGTVYKLSATQGQYMHAPEDLAQITGVLYKNAATRRPAYSTTPTTQAWQNVILLAGMENNDDGRCCSASLLWGTGSSLAGTECYPGYAPVHSAAATASAGCSYGADAYRTVRYTQALERYHSTQAEWLAGGMSDPGSYAMKLSNTAAAFTVADNPWVAIPDNSSPGSVPPLSLDRNVFGTNTRTLFSPAAAAQPGLAYSGGRPYAP